MSTLHGIDIHTHIVPEQFPAYVGRHREVPWPSMNHDRQCNHAHVMISGKNYRTVPHTCWHAHDRAREMDRMRVARQVLSPMPELLSYWLPADDARVMCRHLNETIRAMCDREPARFLGLGCVPLQDVDAAIDELHFVMRDLRLSGVEIASHVNGVSIGDARFEPFFAAADAAGAAIFVHPLRPAGMERLVGPPGTEQIVAFPGDIGLAAASLVIGGTMERHPHLRIALSHGGGAYSIMCARIQHGYTVHAGLQKAMAQPPKHYTNRFYVDTLVYDPHVLRHVVHTFGPDRVMIGTDYPFNIHDRDPHATVDAIDPDVGLSHALREGNARRFLNLAG